MITKFLYQMNVKNKRILTGLIENDMEVAFDESHEIPMVLEDSYILKDGERKISNFGKHYYAVFRENDNYKYLNINDYMLKVKLNASDNVAFASAISKEMIESILYNTEYLNCDYDLKYVDSGLKLNSDLEFEDSYIVFFKKVVDDVYVEFCNEPMPKFLSVVDNKYALVSDFSRALRVYKKEVRNLLITHEYITSSTKKIDVAMSHENVFTSGPQEYIFAGDNSFKISFKDNNLTIEKNPKLTSDFRLANDQTRSQLLRNVLYGFKKPVSHVNKLLKVNNLYVSKTDKLNYLLSSVAAKASLLPETEIEIIKNALSLFIREANFEEISNNSMVNFYLYKEELNYQISSEVKDIDSTLLSQEDATNFIHIYKEYDKLNGKYILKSNNSYLSLDYDKETTSFTLNYLKSGVNATHFTSEEVLSLEKILNKKFEKREIEVVYNYEENLRINKTDNIPFITDMYNTIMEEKNNTNIRFSGFKEISDIRYTSDKGAFEYYEALFMPTLSDSIKLFKKVLNRTNNILLCGTTSNIDLTALSIASLELKKNVNVTILDTAKWGYYPLSYVSSFVKLNGVYRLDLEALPFDFVKQFDLIFIGKTFKCEKEAFISFLNDLKEHDFTCFILNESINPQYEIESKFTIALKGEIEYNKYFLNNKIESNGLITNDKLTYYSILRIKNKKISDAISKK